MNHASVSVLLRRATACLLAVALTIPTVFAAAGEPRLRTSTELMDGLTFHNAITENYRRRVESFSLELKPGSQVKPILVQGSGSIYGGADINQAVRNAQRQGYHVLGAVNTDFFSFSTGVPFGLFIEDGVYKSSNPLSPYKDAVSVGADGSISLLDSPQVKLTLTNSRNGLSVSPDHFNKARNYVGGMYLLNRNFSSSTRVSAPGWNIKFRLVKGGPLTVNSTLTLEVTEVLHTDRAVSIGADEYVLTCDDSSLTAANQDVFSSFRVGDRVTLNTSCSDPVLSNARWVTGVGDVMIRNGKLTDSSQWTYIKDGRAPRTALGVKADGTLLLYAVDGRQSSYSNGLGQLDLAEELLEQGCQWAVNLDGGGSTAMSVWLPGQPGPKLLSRPSNGPRACATYMLLVSPNSGDHTPHRLALGQNDLVVLTGSSVSLPDAAVLDDALNVLSTDPGRVEITSETGLGSVRNNVFTAGSTAGVETLRLSSSKLGVSGLAHIYVVDSLTDLSVTYQGKPVSSLSGHVGDSFQLSVSGSYWDRPTLHNPSGVTWTVTNGAGTVDRNGLFTVTKPTSCTVTATAGGKSVSFSFTHSNTHDDVPKGHWAYDAVEFCYQHGISSGISPTQFGPDLSITRADFVVMIHNALGKPKPAGQAVFTDVSPDDYYYPAIAWAYTNNIVAGEGEGRFAPKDPILREQAFSILYHTLPVMGKPIPDADLSILDRFPDKDQISGWARQAAASLVAQKLVSGGSYGLAPQDTLNRAGMAALMQNLMTFTPSGRGGTVIDADDGLWVRSGPGRDYPPLASLYTGSRVEVLERCGDWYHILYRQSSGSTLEGYVFADYVKLDP